MINKKMFFSLISFITISNASLLNYNGDYNCYPIEKIDYKIKLEVKDYSYKVYINKMNFIKEIKKRGYMDLGISTEYYLLEDGGALFYTKGLKNNKEVKYKVLFIKKEKSDNFYKAVVFNPKTQKPEKVKFICENKNNTYLKNNINEFYKTKNFKRQNINIEKIVENKPLPSKWLFVKIKENNNNLLELKNEDETNNLSTEKDFNQITEEINSDVIEEEKINKLKKELLKMKNKRENKFNNLERKIIKKEKGSFKIINSKKGINSLSTKEEIINSKKGINSLSTKEEIIKKFEELNLVKESDINDKEVHDFYDKIDYKNW